jgi:hypothetical protein
MSCKVRTQYKLIRTRANIEYDRELRRIRIQQAKECSDFVRRAREACYIPKPQ